MIINATEHASSLNKKNVALAYHYVGKHQAGGMIDIQKTHPYDNLSDPL